MNMKRKKVRQKDTPSSESVDGIISGQEMHPFFVVQGKYNLDVPAS